MIYFVNPTSHPNVGDIAIFYATLKFFKDNNLRYTILNRRNYNNFDISINDLIVILGGGWLGIYDGDIVEFYYKVLLEHKNNKIIFLPSSFYPVANSFKKILNIKATIYARDDVSLENYKHYFPYATVKYCPDMVLSLNQINCNRPLEKCCGLYKRSDIESTTVIDNLVGTIESRFTEKMKWIPFNDDIDFYMDIIYRFLFNMAKYPYIITDSLHVSIFSYLLKKPCLIIDNKYKKLSNTWKHFSITPCIALFDQNKKQDIEKYNIDVTSTLNLDYSELTKDLLNMH